MIFIHHSFFQSTGFKSLIENSEQECTSWKRHAFIDLTHDEAEKQPLNSMFAAAYADLLTLDEVTNNSKF
jgi:hypothetical protein